MVAARGMFSNFPCSFVSSAHALQSISRTCILSIIFEPIDNFSSHTSERAHYSKLTVVDGWLRSLVFIIHILGWLLTFETGGTSLIFNGRMSRPSSLLAIPKDCVIDYYNLRLPVVTSGLSYEY